MTLISGITPTWYEAVALHHQTRPGIETLRYVIAFSMIRTGPQNGGGSSAAGAAAPGLPDTGGLPRSRCADSVG